jgi:hypothetical protein
MSTLKVTSDEGGGGTQKPSSEQVPKHVLIVMSPAISGKILSSQLLGSLQGRPEMFSLQIQSGQLPFKKM